MTSSSSGHSSDDRWYELLEPPLDLEHNINVVGNDSPPPPLPARLATSGSVSAFQQVTSTKSNSPHAKVTATHSLPLPQNSAYSLPAKYASAHAFTDTNSPQHEFKVGEKVTTCLLKASERSHELRRQLERTPHDYHLVTRMPKVSSCIYIVSNKLFKLVMDIFVFCYLGREFYPLDTSA